MEQVETMPELMYVSAQSGALRFGAAAADNVVKDRAALPLFALLVEHDSAQSRAFLVQRCDQQPDFPLRIVSPEAELLLHRRVQLGIAPARVNARAGHR